MTRLVESGRVRSQKKTAGRSVTRKKKADAPAGGLSEPQSASPRKTGRKKSRKQRWTPGSTEGLIRRVEELRQLPTMTVEDAALVLGISRASAYAAVRDGEIKVKIYRGRKLVLTRALFEDLGYPV